MKAPEFNYW